MIDMIYTFVSNPIYNPVINHNTRININFTIEDV
jgi:hypothetical protein